MTQANQQQLPYAPPSVTTYEGHAPALHVLALATAIATFPLIFMGGLVTSHGAGMSVPDWPNSYGYNMFTFPPSQWIGGIFYEHTHRLLGTLVGFLAIALTLFAWAPAANPTARRIFGWSTIASALAAVACVLATLLHLDGALNEGLSGVLQHVTVGFASLALVTFVAWIARRRESRRWVRWLTIAVLIAVVVQGVLGGLRVTNVNIDLAVIHGCFAQAFFCLAAFTAVVTSRWWIVALPLPPGEGDFERRTAPDPRMHPHPALSQGERGRDSRLVVLGVASVALIFAQLVVGAMMRHYDAGLAIPDLPLAYGKVLPPMNDTNLAAANATRAWDAGEPRLKPVTLVQVWLHFGHRIGAILVTAALCWFIARTLKRHRDDRMLATPAWILSVLLVTQLTLGVLTVLQRKPADIASLHVAVGALTLMTTFVLTVRAARMASAGSSMRRRSGRREVAPVAQVAGEARALSPA